MSNLALGATILMIMVVISREQILDELPLGTPEQEAVAYFEELTDRRRIDYYTRETSSATNTVSHQLQAGEAGYYIIGVPNVRSRWWLPSLGRTLVVVLVISDAREVSEIKFFGGRVGWP